MAVLLSKIHPFSSFTYFAAVIFSSMLFREPTAVLIAFIFSILMCCVFCGFAEIAKGIWYTALLIAVIGFSNMLFVHRGETVLLFVNGMPLTLEAAFSGAVSAMTVVSVIYLCKCYSKIMTDDKFVYLFGRWLPKLSLILSMTLSVIPRIRRKYNEIEQAQNALGIYGNTGYTDKLKAKLRGVSTLITVSLESSVITSDSMVARGYGLKGRRDSKIYRIKASDIVFAVVGVLLSAALIVIAFNGALSYDFYAPNKDISIRMRFICYTIQTLLYSLALLAEFFWRAKWHYLRSKI